MRTKYCFDNNETKNKTKLYSYLQLQELIGNLKLILPGEWRLIKNRFCLKNVKDVQKLKEYNIFPEGKELSTLLPLQLDFVR